MPSASPSAARWPPRNTTRDTHTIFDHHVIVLAGDGCLQEGVAREAVAFAGAQRPRQPHPHLRLQRRHARRHGEAHPERGHPRPLHRPRLGRRDHRRPRPRRRPRRHRERQEQRQQQAEDHHRQDPDRQRHPRSRRHRQGPRRRRREVRGRRTRRTRPAADQHFFVSDEVRAYFADLKAKRAAGPRRVDKRPSTPGPPPIPSSRSSSTPPQSHKTTAEDLLKLIPEYPAEGKAATRNSGGEILNHIAKADPAPHHRQRRPLRLHQELHQGRRRLLQDQPHRPQHLVRHPRARHGRHLQRHRLRRPLPRQRRHLPGLRRLLPPEHPPRRTLAAAGDLHLHPRLRRRR